MKNTKALLFASLLSVSGLALADAGCAACTGHKPAAKQEKGRVVCTEKGCSLEDAAPAQEAEQAPEATAPEAESAAEGQ